MTKNLQEDYDYNNNVLGCLLSFIIIFTPIACCSGIITHENYKKKLKVSTFYAEHGQIVKVIDIYGDRTKDKFHTSISRAILQTEDGTRLIYSYNDDNTIIPIKNEVYKVTIKANSPFENIGGFDVIRLEKVEK